MQSEHASITYQIIEEVADQAEKTALELPPLQTVIDTDSLDRIIENSKNATIRFTYAGHIVTVHSDGTIDVATDSSRSGSPVELSSDD